jgi:Domain of unknown function (DUF4349)
MNRSTALLAGLSLCLCATTACAGGPTTFSTAPAPAATSAPSGAQALPPAASPATAASQPAQTASDAGRAGAPSDDSAQLPSVPDLGRMVVYTGEVTLVMQQPETLATQAAQIAAARGGYLDGVDAKDVGGIPTTVVKLRVEPARYEDAMSALRNLAVDVRNEKTATQDVTEQYDDVQTQLASLEATHAQLVQLQSRSGTMEEVLKVQQQAAQVKLQIDRLKGRQAVLQRLTALATITANAQSAALVLPRDYATALSAVRKAASAHATAQAELARARTPEEVAALQDKLAATALDQQQQQAKADALAAKAGAAGVALPTPDASADALAPAQQLPRDYVATRVALRQADHDQALLTADLQGPNPAHKPDELTAAILRVRDLTSQLRLIQERAQQANVELPTLSDDQLTVLSGVGPVATAPDVAGLVRTAWEASLRLLSALGAAVLAAVVFLWWTVPAIGLGAFVVRRRRAARP